MGASSSRAASSTASAESSSRRSTTTSSSSSSSASPHMSLPKGHVGVWMSPSLAQSLLAEGGGVAAGSRRAAEAERRAHRGEEGDTAERPGTTTTTAAAAAAMAAATGGAGGAGGGPGGEELLSLLQGLLRHQEREHALEIHRIMAQAEEAVQEASKQTEAHVTERLTQEFQNHYKVHAAHAATEQAKMQANLQAHCNRVLEEATQSLEDEVNTRTSELKRKIFEAPAPRSWCLAEENQVLQCYTKAGRPAAPMDVLECSSMVAALEACAKKNAQALAKDGTGSGN